MTNELFLNRQELAREYFARQFFGGSYYRLPKDSVKLFGVNKAVFLAYLFDLANYADYHNQTDFFATRDKISNDLGFSERVIGDYFAFFKEQGILESYRKGIDPRKWYKLNHYKLFDYALKVGYFKESPSADSATDNTGKSCHSPSADSATTIFNKNKELNQNKDIKTNSEPRVFKKEDFENLKTSNEVKDFLNTLPKIDKDRFLKEFLAYKQEFAKKLYEESNYKPSIDLNMWIKYILSKDKACLKQKRYVCLNAIEKDFKCLFKLQDLGYLEKRIDDAIENEWQGIWFDNDAKAFNNGNFKPKHDPRKGRTGESVFSDNPDDYINPNTQGVKSVKGAIYEVDLWELTGRK